MTLKALIINRSIRVLIERSWLDYWAVTDYGREGNLQKEMATTGNITINVRNLGDLISIDDGWSKILFSGSACSLRRSTGES